MKMPRWRYYFADSCNYPGQRVLLSISRSQDYELPDPVPRYLIIEVAGSKVPKKNEVT